MTVGIVGLGYVGLPLAMAFAEKVAKDAALTLDLRGVTRGVDSSTVVRP